MDESKQLEFEVTTLERKISIRALLPNPKAAQEQQAEGEMTQAQSPPTGERAETESLSH